MINQHHNGSGNNINVEGDVNISSIQQHPTILAAIINELGNELLVASEPENETFKQFNISNKIEHNKISKYKQIFEEHKIYHGKLNAIYKELDEQGSDKKEILLKNIQTMYLKIKNDNSTKKNDKKEQTVIGNNADQIIEEIENKLIIKIKKSQNIKQPLEIIETGTLIIMIDAFMRCKILEAPK